MDLAVALGAGGFLAGLTRRRESAPLSAFAFAVGCGTVLLFSGRLRAGWITGGLLGTAALALYPPVGRKWLGDTFRRLGNVPPPGGGPVCGPVAHPLGAHHGGDGFPGAHTLGGQAPP